MRIAFALALFLLVLSCAEKPKAPRYDQADAEILYACEKKLTDLIVTDIFSPPVASRVYVYPTLAAYECARFAREGNESMTASLNGFEDMPQPEPGLEYDFTVSMVQAFCETARKVVFSKAAVTEFQNSTLEKLKTRSSLDVFDRSIQFGNEVAAVIGKRLTSDNYKETRGMERFEVTTQPGRWVPTPPDYADGVEPHWPKMKTMALDSSSQVQALPYPAYSLDKSSDFWKELNEVYDFVNIIKEEDERMEILTFWDDNPFVSRHKGHLMFQDKKMTPGGHWLAIARIVSRHSNADLAQASKAMALTSVALYDGFISCWYVKYSTARLRPETAINAAISKDWHPHLVTPPFPAYTSGHSTVSASAAEALTGIYGDNFAFTDSTEHEYGLPIRSFKSFRQAAEEASISRVYAGIHYRSDCENGNEQGKRVGQVVLARLQVKADTLAGNH